MSYENVKPGDKLITYTGGLWSYARIETVIRLTKTQIVCEHSRYNKQTEYEVGGKGGIIKIATEIDIKKMNTQNEISELCGTICDDLISRKPTALIKNAGQIKAKLDELTALNAELEQLEKGEK